MVQSVPPATRAAASRSPAWTREEDILALDLFIRCGVMNGGPFIDENDPHVIALSRELRLLRANPGAPRHEKYRSPGVVAFKLLTFRGVERAVKLDRGIEGAGALPAGMPAFSAVDRAIFEEYFDRDFRGLAEDALAIRSTAGRLELAAMPAGGQDRPVGNPGLPAYETAGAEGGHRTRAQYELVSRYGEWLAKSRIRAVSRLYWAPGLARPFFCDVFLPDRNVLIEAAPSDRRTDLRMAIGQLMDYRHFEGTAPSTAILLPAVPAAETREFLADLGIGIVWPHGDGFRDSVGGNCTRP
jgi:hypothetical protein